MSVMKPMTPGERNEFVRLSKQRVRAMKAEGDLRAARIVEAFETEISALYAADDDRWAEGVQMAHQAATALNQQIAEHFRALGLNPQHAPSLEIAWHGRGREASSKERRAELRAQAVAQANVVKKQALATAERIGLEIETKLLVEDTPRVEAQALIKGMPKMDELMPELNVERIEAIAREADRAQRRYYGRLWPFPNEPLLTGKPIRGLPAGERDSSGEYRGSVAERFEALDENDIPPEEGDDGELV